MQKRLDALKREAKLLGVELAPDPPEPRQKSESPVQNFRPQFRGGTGKPQHMRQPRWQRQRPEWHRDRDRYRRFRSVSGSDSESEFVRRSGPRSMVVVSNEAHEKSDAEERRVIRVTGKAASNEHGRDRERLKSVENSQNNLNAKSSGVKDSTAATQHDSIEEGECSDGRPPMEPNDESKENSKPVTEAEEDGLMKKRHYRARSSSASDSEGDNQVTRDINRFKEMRNKDASKSTDDSKRSTSRGKHSKHKDRSRRSKSREKSKRRDKEVSRSRGRDLRSHSRKRDRKASESSRRDGQRSRSRDMKSMREHSQCRTHRDERSRMDTRDRHRSRSRDQNSGRNDRRRWRSPNKLTSSRDRSREHKHSHNGDGKHSNSQERRHSRSRERRNSRSRERKHSRSRERRNSRSRERNLSNGGRIQHSRSRENRMHQSRSRDARGSQSPVRTFDRRRSLSRRVSPLRDGRRGRLDSSPARSQHDKFKLSSRYSSDSDNENTLGVTRKSYRSPRTVTGTSILDEIKSNPRFRKRIEHDKLSDYDSASSDVIIIGEADNSVLNITQSPKSMPLPQMSEEQLANICLPPEPQNIELPSEIPPPVKPSISELVNNLKSVPLPAEPEPPKAEVKKFSIQLNKTGIFSSNPVALPGKADEEDLVPDSIPTGPNQVGPTVAPSPNVTISLDSIKLPDPPASHSVVSNNLNLAHKADNKNIPADIQVTQIQPPVAVVKPQQVQQVVKAASRTAKRPPSSSSDSSSSSNSSSSGSESDSSSGTSSSSSSDSSSSGSSSDSSSSSESSDSSYDSKHKRKRYTKTKSTQRRTMNNVRETKTVLKPDVKPLSKPTAVTADKEIVQPQKEKLLSDEYVKDLKNASSYFKKGFSNTHSSNIDRAVSLKDNKHTESHKAVTANKYSTDNSKGDFKRDSFLGQAEVKSLGKHERFAKESNELKQKSSIYDTNMSRRLSERSESRESRSNYSDEEKPAEICTVKQKSKEINEATTKTENSRRRKFTDYPEHEETIEEKEKYTDRSKRRFTEDENKNSKKRHADGVHMPRRKFTERSNDSNISRRKYSDVDDSERSRKYKDDIDDFTKTKKSDDSRKISGYGDIYDVGKPRRKFTEHTEYSHDKNNKDFSDNSDLESKKSSKPKRKFSDDVDFEADLEERPKRRFTDKPNDDVKEKIFPHEAIMNESYEKPQWTKGHSGESHHKTLDHTQSQTTKRRFTNEPVSSPPAEPTKEPKLLFPIERKRRKFTDFPDEDAIFPSNNDSIQNVSSTSSPLFPIQSVPEKHSFSEQAKLSAAIFATKKSIPHASSSQDKVSTTKKKRIFTDHPVESLASSGTATYSTQSSPHTGSVKYGHSDSTTATQSGREEYQYSMQATQKLTSSEHLTSYPSEYGTMPGGVPGLADFNSFLNVPDSNPTMSIPGLGGDLPETSKPTIPGVGLELRNKLPEATPESMKISAPKIPGIEDNFQRKSEDPIPGLGMEVSSRAVSIPGFGEFTPDLPTSKPSALRVPAVNDPTLIVPDVKHPAIIPDVQHPTISILPPVKQPIPDVQHPTISILPQVKQPIPNVPVPSSPINDEQSTFSSFINDNVMSPAKDSESSRFKSRPHASEPVTLPLANTAEGVSRTEGGTRALDSRDKYKSPSKTSRKHESLAKTPSQLGSPSKASNKHENTSKSSDREGNGDHRSSRHHTTSCSSKPSQKPTLDGAKSTADSHVKKSSQTLSSEKKASDDGRKKGSSDDGRNKGSSDDGRKKGSSDDGRKKGSSDDGRKKGSSDDGRKKGSSDDGRKKGSSDDGRNKGSSDVTSKSLPSKDEPAESRRLFIKRVDSDKSDEAANAYKPTLNYNTKSRPGEFGSHSDKRQVLMSSKSSSSRRTVLPPKDSVLDTRTVLLNPSRTHLADAKNLKLTFSRSPPKSNVSDSDSSDSECARLRRKLLENAKQRQIIDKPLSQISRTTSRQDYESRRRRRSPSSSSDASSSSSGVMSVIKGTKRLPRLERPRSSSSDSSSDSD